ncbi:DUF1398 domain-containing protein [Methylocystis parvus]|uniref:DUF1398 domain-containing protein n=1 Tax=Methylocystis parvus TaxID=134 RepID=A0A6B8M6P2_9HYPH|nr:DUF1398 family protein [Methylocystis parvus]QGM98148.1 DUF1398 domain-containing protein [Methylocystis parvus]WBK01530.1 DUF1398 domain-containing protein [Methylocystis parvus OBBP]
MDAHLSQIAESCLRAAESDGMNFPEIVERLMEAGFESYAIDFRRATATYYLPDGESVVLPTHRHHAPIAATLNVAALQAAIREAQQSAPNYAYLGFCEKVMAGGCAGYVVSFPGRRAVYFGRAAETHVEHFPRQG